MTTIVTFLGDRGFRETQYSFGDHAQWFKPITPQGNGNGGVRKKSEDRRVKKMRRKKKLL
jgi:hypothetical protein